MHALVDAFKLAKAGNTPSEYEDAYWPPNPVDQVVGSLRLAVADGATEASFSSDWAKLLVRAYGREWIDAERLEKGLPYLQQAWLRHVGKKPLPWYAEEKLRSGAFAAVTGIQIANASQGDGPGRWDALAVGDSCLFHIRGDMLLRTFPLGQSNEFGNRPLLVSSVPAGNRGLREAVQKCSGDWEGGDTFYLMTDALACWFLRGWELRSDPLGFLRSLRGASDFEEFVAFQRQDKGKDGTPMLKNDDVTLVRCTITPG